MEFTNAFSYAMHAPCRSFLLAVGSLRPSEAPLPLRLQPSHGIYVEAEED